MSYQLRAPIVFAPALLLLSSLAAVGQTDSNKDRTVAGNPSSAYRRDRSRPVSRDGRTNAITKLPFERSVIIYYKGPEKKSPPTDPAVSTPGVRKSEDPKTTRTDTDGSLANQPARPSLPSSRAETAVDLQPVIIYYGGYRPAAAAKSSEQRPAEPKSKPAAAASLIRNGSTAKRSGALSNAVASDPARIAEQNEPTDVARSVRNEIPPANLNANLNDTPLAGPKQSLSEPVANSIRPADTGITPTKLAVNAPEIEIADPAVEKTAEKSVAPTVDVPETRPKIEPPQQNSAIGAAASNITPTSLSAIIPEESAPAISTVVAPPNPGSDPKAGGTTTGPETENRPVDAVGLNNSAVQLTLESRYAEAHALLQRAIEAEPTAAKFHRNLSLLFKRMKKFDEALASARIAAKLAPADPPIVEWLCELELVTGNAPAALGCYENLKSIGPLDALSQTYYGIALFRSGKEDESITILEQAGRSTPPIAEAMNALGVVYFKKKRFDDAAGAFKNAVEVAPDLFETRYNLAVAYLALRNKAAAISQYNIIKVGDPKLAAQLYRMLGADKVLFVNDSKNPK